ncbi:MAG: addiction module protein [Pseudoxanthomonas sp.]
MSAVLQQIHELLPALSDAERFQLYRELEVGLIDVVEPQDDDAQAWTAEIDRRIAEIDAGTAKLVSGDEFIRELRSHARGR